MDLLTSYKGKAHLTSMQFRALIESICGSESRIANLDEKMILELAENNTVKIRSGILIHHGAVMQVKRGTYDPITYQNGSQGMKRIDLIVAKYSKSADTKIEDAEWEIIQGEASDSDPVVPTFTEGDMQDGDLIDRCAFAELHFDGINVTEVKQLVPVARNTKELEAELDELNRKWSDELTGNNQYCKYRYVKFGKTAIIIGNLTANSNNNISITFPFEFKFTPSASVTLESSASSTVNPLITQISTTSFRADSTPGSTTKTATRFIIIGEIE